MTYPWPGFLSPPGGRYWKITVLSFEGYPSMKAELIGKGKNIRETWLFMKYYDLNCSKETSERFFLFFCSACTTTNPWHHAGQILSKGRTRDTSGADLWESRVSYRYGSMMWNIVHLDQGGRSVTSGNARHHALAGWFENIRKIWQFDVNCVTVHAELLIPLRKRHPAASSMLTRTIYLHMYTPSVYSRWFNSLQLGNCFALSTEIH